MCGGPGAECIRPRRQKILASPLTRRGGGARILRGDGAVILAASTQQADCLGTITAIIV